jgi:hypothetical protein
LALFSSFSSLFHFIGLNIHLELCSGCWIVVAASLSSLLLSSFAIYILALPACRSLTSNVPPQRNSYAFFWQAPLDPQSQWSLEIDDDMHLLDSTNAGFLLHKGKGYLD